MVDWKLALSFLSPCRTLKETNDPCADMIPKASCKEGSGGTSNVLHRSLAKQTTPCSRNYITPRQC